MSTIGEQLVHVLLQAGVTRVYGVIGDSLNPFVDAIRRTEGIEWIHVRNEEAGSLRGRRRGPADRAPGPCVREAAGRQHAPDPGTLRCPPRRCTRAGDRLATSRRSRSGRRSSRRRTRNGCSWSAALLRAGEPGVANATPGTHRDPARDRAGRRLRARHARRRALSVRGASTGESSPITVRGTVVPPQDQVHELAERLNRARTVTIFCGAGVRGAHDEVMALAEKVHSPIVHSLQRQGVGAVRQPV